MPGEAFLRPRLRGERFEDASIPLQVLADLAALREMVLEVAKWRFLEANPDRKRAPRGFTNRIELKLTGVEEGSAVPVISLVSTEPSLNGFGLPPYQEYFEMARDDIANTIASVSGKGQSADNMTLPPKYLSYFNRIGRGLRDREYFEFDVPNSSTPARLTREARNLLLQAASVTEIMQEVNLRGTVPEADQDKMTFELQQVYGIKVVCPLPNLHRDTIVEAFAGYENNVRILVQGIGHFDLQNRLSDVETVDSVSLLESLDVPARLDELRSMKDGEYDGRGSAPNHEGLDWLSHSFEHQYPDDLPLPNAYPTPEGGLEMEWSNGHQTIIFGINLITHEGDWFQFDRISDSDTSRELNLDTSEDWQWVSNQIRQMTITQ
jgi:hypothetical protein